MPLHVHTIQRRFALSYQKRDMIFIMCYVNTARSRRKYMYIYTSVPPRINEKGGGGGGGDLAGEQSVKLYLGAWCMYILHS